MLELYQTILWDFDGVILDSVDIRDEGYLHVLKKYPDEKVDELLQFQRLNGGLSRYVKFRYFYEEILGERISDDKVNDFARQFSDYMVKKLTDTNLLIGDSLEFIRDNHKKYSMHVVSGSDENELRFLCKELKISRFFKSIHGSPTPKITLVKNILADHGYDSKRVALVGDSINDFDAADRNNISFFGYNNPVLRKKGEGYITAFSPKLSLEQ